MVESTKRPHMGNEQVAELFRSTSDLLQILGESRFVVLAYQNAARTIEGLEEDINAVAAAGALQDLPKVGKKPLPKRLTLFSKRARCHITTKSPRKCLKALWQ